MSTNDTCEFTPPAAATDGVACELPGVAPASDPGRNWASPSQQERFALLRRSRSVAIVGASNNPARASYFVATYLLSSSPYDVYFVNPMADEILGQPAYASLADLPVVPDIVDVFRKHDDLPGVAQEAVDVGAKALWLQLGSWNEDAAAIAEGAGLSVVMDRCIKIEHARFHGGLHLAGFDTGVISSKRQLLGR
ncbi:CoA-binding protein [Microbacterium aerolatum]|uniref:CoA-binding protein n=1 Tax=Microbacterium aerolatum TaxID=153731 RepID=A0A511AFB3_9MICO|nr:CoA-binding protein [Microbacterium aerolatum]GEK86845.1 CoA-binding protein [Microbacterium aerolatum]GGB24656.1 CoA-binding protein [Microbacterium aerolatum]